MCYGSAGDGGEDLLHDRVAAVLPLGLDQVERQAAAVEGVGLAGQGLYGTQVASAVTEASATPAAAMRATCFLPADPSLVMVMSACPGMLCPGPGRRHRPDERSQRTGTPRPPQ